MAQNKLYHSYFEYNSSSPVDGNIFLNQKVTLEILYKLHMVENKKCFTLISKNMKSKDIQKVVKTKYENEDGPARIYRDLAGAVSLPTIKL